jgi:15-cis-phytoene synthase
MISPSQSMRKHGKTFYWASRFLEKEIANRFYAVYQFCRNIDDLVDEKKDKDTLKNIIQTWKKKKDHKIFDSFKSLEPRLVPQEHLLKEFFNGQSFDINQKQPKTLNELIIYCYRVAGVVGLMLCDVMELKNKTLRHYAIDLGIAMQLTNIARDIYEDANNNRIYIPETMIGKVSPEKLINPSVEQERKINHARDKLIDLADHYYQSANVGIQFLPKQTQRTIFIAAHLYREIGIKIKINCISYDEPRVFLTKYEKIIKTIKFLFKKQRVISNIPQHNYLLHKAIHKLPEANNV